MSEKHYHYETLQLHAGQDPDPATNARAVPIYQTTSYVFDDADHAASLFGLQQFGNIYTRIMNPTTDVFEKRVAALEGGVAAVATASGQAAQLLTVTTLAQAGDNIVSTSYLYGGTYNQFKVALPRLGINVKFVDGDDADAIAAAIDENTKARVRRVDRQPAVQRARPRADRRRCPRSGRPADRRQHLRGCRLPGAPDRPRRRHRGGVGHQVDRRPRHLDRRHHRRLRQLRLAVGDASRSSPTRRPATTGSTSVRCSGPTGRSATSPSPSGPRVEGLRDLGAAQSPFNSFLFLQGLETLSLRVQRHVDNALELAQWLERPPAGGLGQLPGPPRRTHRTRRRSSTSATASARCSRFGVVGGYEAAKTFIESVEAGEPPRQRRRRQDARDPPGFDHPPAARRPKSRTAAASRRTWCGSRSASSTSTTSRRTSTRRSRELRQPRRHEVAGG